jgi:HSP20 family protein
MADPQVDNASANASTKGSRDAQRNAADQSQRDTRRNGHDQTRRALEGERRNFQEAADDTARTAATSFEAARDMARRGAETTRQITETGRRTGAELVDLWRSAFDPLLHAQLEANRWFDQVWRQATGLGMLPALQPARPFASSPAPLFGQPPADVCETDQSYILAIELPGLAREDLDLQIVGDTLVIAGRKTEAREVNAGAYRMSERRFGRFERSFPIPPDVRRERLEATFKDGVLTVTLPKAEEARQPVSRVNVRGG